MVTSDRRKHCEILLKMLEEIKEAEPCMLTGKVSKGKRNKMLDDLKAGRYNVLIATASLLSEGFDFPELGSLFMATPMKFTGRVLQVIGRTTRPYKDKEAAIYDFRDRYVQPLLYAGFHRDRLYKKAGWKVVKGKEVV